MKCIVDPLRRAEVDNADSNVACRRLRIKLGLWIPCNERIHQESILLASLLQRNELSLVSAQISGIRIRSICTQLRSERDEGKRQAAGLQAECTQPCSEKDEVNGQNATLQTQCTQLDAEKDEVQQSAGCGATSFYHAIH